MATIEQIKKLCTSIISHFKNTGEWKKARGGSNFVLVQYKNKENRELDLYIFMGISNKGMPDKYRIALAVKEPSTIELLSNIKEKLVNEYGELEGFKLRGNISLNDNQISEKYIKFKKGIFDWQEDFIAIRHKWYNGDLSTILDNKSDEYVKEKVLNKYKEEWEDLTDNIINYLLNNSK